MYMCPVTGQNPEAVLIGRPDIGNVAGMAMCGSLAAGDKHYFIFNTTTPCGGTKAL